MNDVMGIVYTSKDDLTLRELTSQRAVAAIPVAGRYRIIDFTLSNLVNSGVRNVGIIAQKNYHSLMDHLGSGKEWDLHTRNNGLFILPIFSAVSQFFTSKFMNAGQQSSNAQQASTNKFMQWFFPLFSLWICASSNAAFALYWVFINVFQIAQQFIIGKLIDRSENKKKLIEEASTK